MTTYVVTFNIENNARRSTFLKTICNHSGWAPLNENTYAVQTQKSPKAFFDDLSSDLTRDDRLYIMKVAKPFFIQGLQQVEHWLEEVLD